MKLLLLCLLTLPLFATVVTQEVTRGTLTQSQSFNGTLSFNQKARLASQSSGLIEKIYFDEADYVKRDNFY